MEDQDHLRFVEGLKFEREHDELDGKSGQKQEIIAGERRIVGPQKPGADDQRQHCPAEEARPGLLETEHDELDQRARKAASRKPVENRMRGGVDPRLE